MASLGGGAVDATLAARAGIDERGALRPRVRGLRRVRQEEAVRQHKREASS